MNQQPDGDGQIIIHQLKSRFYKKPRICKKINDSGIGDSERILCLSDDTFYYYPKIQEFKDLDFDKLQYVIPKAGVKLVDIHELKFPNRRNNQRNYFSMVLPKNKILKYTKDNKEHIVDENAQGDQRWTFYFTYDIIILPEKQRRIERFLNKKRKHKPTYEKNAENKNNFNNSKKQRQIEEHYNNFDLNAQTVFLQKIKQIKIIKKNVEKEIIRFFRHLIKCKILNNLKQNCLSSQMEIDQEFAKCLNMLDRQGLKYLKQTFKAPIVFGTQQIQEDIAVSLPPSDTKLITKRIQKQISEEIQQEIPENLVIQEFQQGQEQSHKSRKHQQLNNSKIRNKETVAEFDLNQFKINQQINEHSRPFGKKDPFEDRNRITKKQHNKASSQINKQNNNKQTKFKKVRIIVKIKLTNQFNALQNCHQKKFKNYNQFSRKLNSDRKDSVKRPIKNNRIFLSTKQKQPRQITHSSRVLKNNSKSRFAEKASSIYPTIIKNKNLNNESNTQKQQKLHQDIKEGINIDIPENQNNHLAKQQKTNRNTIQQQNHSKNLWNQDAYPN